MTEHGAGWQKGCLPVRPDLTLTVDSRPASVWPFLPSLSTPCSPGHLHLHPAPQRSRVTSCFRAVTLAVPEGCMAR